MTASNLMDLRDLILSAIPAILAGILLSRSGHGDFSGVAMLVIWPLWNIMFKLSARK